MVATIERPLEIKKLSFERASLRIVLTDSREILMPLRTLPESIRKLSPVQRRKAYVTGTDRFNLIFFHDSDEIFRLTESLTLEAV